MKIALIAPVEEAVPPIKYGGTERIVYEVAHGIGKLGHTVDLYASGDSRKESNYTLYPTVKQHLRATDEYKDDIKMRDMKKMMLLSDIVDLLHKKNYDIIHNHMGWRYLIFSHFVHGPVVTTHHGPLNAAHHNLVYLAYKEAFHVSISNNQRKDLPQLNYIATVYNGVNINELPFAPEPKDDYMLFLARISPEKGPLSAIHTALRLKKQLIIASKIDAADREYYEKEVKPIVDNECIVLKGELEIGQKVPLLQNAKLLLVPIQWEEPFGLMFTEAMAVGAPVVTFARGSAPEIIVDGVTGFLVNESEELKHGDFIVKKMGIDGLCEAVERIYSMPKEEYLQMRKNCRAHVEKNFTVEKMVDEYEKVYQKILSRNI
jgi:glycosyltransferase involved in cell wall biosynthesis